MEALNDFFPCPSLKTITPKEAREVKLTYFSNTWLRLAFLILPLSESLCLYDSTQVSSVPKIFCIDHAK